MFERFTDHARHVLVLAQEEARLLNHSFVGTEHILLGLIHEGDGVAARALDSLGVSLQAVREKVVETIGAAGSAPTAAPPYTPRAKKVLELSLREATQLGHTSIDTEHLLLGLLREGEGVAAQVLVSLGVSLGRVRQRVVKLIANRRVEETGGEDVPLFGPRSGSPGLAKRGRPWVPPLSRCALCGRDLWEVEHFVASSQLRICDECVRAAGRLLDEATSEHRELVMPPRVFGHPPDDQAVAAIVDAVQVAMNASSDPHSLAAVIEDFEELEATFRRRATRLPDATSLLRVRFLTPDVAEVLIEITRPNGAMASYEGQVRRRDGHWMVTAATVASVLLPRGMRFPPRTAE